MIYQIKCRQCRKLIIEDSPTEARILNAHGAPLSETTPSCRSLNDENIVFLSEDFLPGWITEKIEEVQWTRARLNCPHCDSRIGAFDYISGTKCDCNEKILPSVHVIKSKIDLVKTNR